MMDLPNERQRARWMAERRGRRSHRSPLNQVEPAAAHPRGRWRRRFVLAQYHQGQVTIPRLLALLRAFGILISKRQLVRLLIAGQDDFLDEARDVLRVGLISAAWITVDDTGARHKAANGFCTQIGNAH